MPSSPPVMDRNWLERMKVNSIKARVTMAKKIARIRRENKPINTERIPEITMEIKKASARWP